MTASSFPEYLTVTRDELAKKTSVRLQVVGNMEDVARHMANHMFTTILSAKDQGRELTMIAPVGPVDQFPILAEMINRHGVNCQETAIINMDEYLTDRDEWIDLEHPLSFRGYMNRKFYDLVDDKLAPRAELRIFPDPRDLDAIPRLIDQRGGVDVTYGGIGINGHLAFNDPPADFDTEKPYIVVDLDEGCRKQQMGEGWFPTIEDVPKQAISMSIKHICKSQTIILTVPDARKAEAVKGTLEGEISNLVPASILQNHDDTTLYLDADSASLLSRE